MSIIKQVLKKFFHYYSYLFPGFTPGYAKSTPTGL
jgi:hypothetical protein